ncbi:MAG: hypothetical protein J7513_01820 [Solirubrobacteraceae bacterium]|nr:hypothetical protein [Solirubrobacteraceae bacterium]
MCFSATADLTAAAIVAPVGVVALRMAPTRADFPIAALPLLFAVHQGVEAFVWFGLQGTVSVGVMNAAILAYLLIAQIVLPLLVPLGVRAIEPVPWRRRALLFPLAAGAAVAVWVVYVLNVEEIAAHVDRHALVYETDYRLGPISTALYAVATLGAVLLTSRRELLVFGLVNAAGFVGAALVRYESVTSVWCVYAALTSAVVLLHLQVRRREERARRRPVAVDPARAPGV